MGDGEYTFNPICCLFVKEYIILTVLFPDGCLQCTGIVSSIIPATLIMHTSLH